MWCVIRRLKQNIPLEMKIYLKKHYNPRNIMMRICNFLKMNGYDLTNICILDLLYPIDGKISTPQIIAISRYLDIKDYYQKGRLNAQFKWQTLFSELMHKRRRMSLEEKTNENEYFRAIIESFETDGMIPEYGYIRVNTSPLTAADGTHRLGYFIYKNELSWFPILLNKRVANDDEVLFENTEEWLETIGMEENEKDFLFQTYKSILSQYNYSLCGIVDLSIWSEDKQLMNKMLENGEICNIKYSNVKDILAFNHESVHTIYKIFGFGVKDLPIVTFEYKPFKQYLYLKHSRIVSKYIIEIEKIGQSHSKHWGYIAHSFSESQGMKLSLQEDKKLKI